MKTIGVFDHQVIPSNPIGGCHLRILDNLADEHRFTVFAARFENPRPDRIRWIRVPVPTRPLALQFVCYHMLAPLYHVAFRLRYKTTFDLVQAMENCVLRSDVAYVQFCHRAYLRQHWAQAGARGIRGGIRWLDHRVRSFLEPIAYRRVRRIVVPSRGFAKELAAEYPWLEARLTVLPNPIDVPRLRRPPDFDRCAFRAGHGLASEDVVLVFVALGQYERKGLPLLMEALARISDPGLKLLVVGGELDLVEIYRQRAKRMGLEARMAFVGLQRDVRPYLWAADAFAFPSSYETFSLVTFEAGAAGLPLLVSPLHGVSDVLADGENGFLLERTAEGVEAGIRGFLALSVPERERMGEHARRSVAAYSVPSFLAAWRDLYEGVLGGNALSRR